jgi:hypothetical protein
MAKTFQVGLDIVKGNEAMGEEAAQPVAGADQAIESAFGGFVAFGASGFTFGLTAPARGSAPSRSAASRKSSA